MPSPIHVNMKGTPGVIELYALFVNMTTAWAKSGANRAVVMVEKRMMDAVSMIRIIGISNDRRMQQ